MSTPSFYDPTNLFSTPIYNFGVQSKPNFSKRRYDDKNLGFVFGDSKSGVKFTFKHPLVNENPRKKAKTSKLLKDPEVNMDLSDISQEKKWDFGVGDNWKSMVSDRTRQILEVFLSDKLNDFKVNVQTEEKKYISLYCTKKEIYGTNSFRLRTLLDTKDFKGEMDINSEVCLNITAVLIVLYLLGSNNTSVVEEILNNFPSGSTLLGEALLLANYLQLDYVEHSIRIILPSYSSINIIPYLIKTQNDILIDGVCNTYVYDSIKTQRSTGRNKSHFDVPIQHQHLIKNLTNRLNIVDLKLKEFNSKMHEFKVSNELFDKKQAEIKEIQNIIYN